MSIENCFKYLVLFISGLAVSIPAIGQDKKYMYPTFEDTFKLPAFIADTLMNLGLGFYIENQVTGVDLNRDGFSDFAFLMLGPLQKDSVRYENDFTRDDGSRYHSTSPSFLEKAYPRLLGVYLGLAEGGYSLSVQNTQFSNRVDSLDLNSSAPKPGEPNFYDRAGLIYWYGYIWLGVTKKGNLSFDQGPSGSGQFTKSEQYRWIDGHFRCILTTEHASALGFRQESTWNLATGLWQETQWSAVKGHALLQPLTRKGRRKINPLPILEASAFGWYTYGYEN